MLVLVLQVVRLRREDRQPSGRLELETGVCMGTVALIIPCTTGSVDMNQRLDERGSHGMIQQQQARSLSKQQEYLDRSILAAGFGVGGLSLGAMASSSGPSVCSVSTCVLLVEWQVVVKCWFFLCLWAVKDKNDG
jgi:hypothetical protein